MHRFIIIPAIILAGFFLVVAGCAELPAGNAERAVFAVR